MLRRGETPVGQARRRAIDRRRGSAPHRALAMKTESQGPQRAVSAARERVDLMPSMCAPKPTGTRLRGESGERGGTSQERAGQTGRSNSRHRSHTGSDAREARRARLRPGCARRRMGARISALCAHFVEISHRRSSGALLTNSDKPRNADNCRAVPRVWRFAGSDGIIPLCSRRKRVRSAPAPG